MQSNLRVGIIGGFEDGIGHLGRMGQEALGQPHRMTAHARVPVDQRRPHIFGAECLQAVKRAQGMQARLRPGMRRGHGLQERHSRLILVPKQHGLGQVALRPIGRIEGCHQSFRGKLVETDHRPRLGILRINAIDAAQVVPGPDVEPGQVLGRNPLGMLDHQAVHIDHPQGAVGPGPHLNRTKPVVRPGQELSLRLVCRTPARERDAPGLQLQAMHQKIDRFAREGIARVFLAKKVVAIDADATRRSHAPRRSGELEQLHVALDREQQRRVRVVRDVDLVGRRGEIRVAPQITIGQRIVSGQDAVIAAEPVTPIVAYSALLGAALGRLDRARIRVDAEIPVCQVMHQPAGKAADLTAEQAT